MNFKKFLPAHLGGPEKNIYNVFIHRLTLPKNRKPLWDYVKKTRPKRILEIGLGIGYNARKMMELADDCEYYCFDDLHWGVSREVWEDMRDKDNVSFFIGDTKKTLPKHIKDLPKMDLIFIDGGHDYVTVKNDWKHCKKLIHKDTACFFHDYNEPGVKRAVSEIGGGYSKKIIKPPSSPPDFALVTKDENLIKN